MNRLFVLAMLCATAPALAQEPAREPVTPILETAQRDVQLAAARDPVVEAGAALSAQQPATRTRDVEALIPRPRLSGSSTGYVDNAIIGSQIRLRFDAAFGNEALDRGEFFYGKCGCYRELGGVPGAPVDLEAPGPAPALNGRDPLTTKFIETGVDYREFIMEAEYAPHNRFSVFATVPLRSVSPDINPSATGIGDVRAGVKLGLVASDATALTFQFRSYFASGDARKALGTDHASTEFTLLFNQKLSDRASVAAEFGDWHPIGGSKAVLSSSGKFTDDILRFGVGASYDIAAGASTRFAPVIELVGWRLLGGNWTQSVDGTLSTASVLEAKGTIVNLKIGARLTFSGRNSVYVGYGFPLSDAEWYNDIIRVEYRFAF